MTTKRLQKHSARSNRNTSRKRAHWSGSVSRNGSGHKPRHGSRLAKSRGRTAPSPARLVVFDEKHQASVRNFEIGLRYLQRQNYHRAREVFEKLTTTARPDVADRSRVLLKVCVDRLGAKPPSPRTAADYHVLGVAELNARDLDRAVEHLSKAENLQPKSEEIRYALAAAHSLKGNADAAMEHLKAAIALRPQNRFQARRDPDFRSLAGDPRFLSLVAAPSEANARRAS
jgi:tetratricopeptide (TPR) repeat protein